MFFLYVNHSKAISCLKSMENFNFSVVSSVVFDMIWITTVRKKPTVY